jgi:uncharacterized membrane protein YidH (DUF202 family)
MKPIAVIGILLIVFGVFALAYGGFSYTKKEKVIDLGPLQATTEEHKTVPLPPILGGAALVAGVVLLVLGNKKST